MALALCGSAWVPYTSAGSKRPRPTSARRSSTPRSGTRGSARSAATGSQRSPPGAIRLRSAAPRRSGVSTPGKRRPAPPRRRRRARPGARSSSADVAPRRHRTGARGRQPTRPGRALTEARGVTVLPTRVSRLPRWKVRSRRPPPPSSNPSKPAMLRRRAGVYADDAKLLAPGRPDPRTSRDRGILAHRNRPGAHGRRVRASGARSGRRERGGDRSLRRLGQRRRRRASP